MCVMRGPCPAIPERAGATLTHLTATAAFGCAVRVREGYAGASQRAHMDPNLRRRNGGRPRVPHRPRNGTGNPKQHYERYLTKAREAQQAGDEIEMENCYQH